MRRRFAFALVSAPLAIPLLACLATPAPEGDLVGDFLVRGVLEANECGAAVPANDTIELRVQVRRDGNLATWRTPTTAIVHGTHTDGTFTFSHASVVPVFEADPVLGTPGCTLDQLERIDISAQGVAQSDASTDTSTATDASTDAATEVADAGMDTSMAMGDAAVPSVTLEGQSVLRYQPGSGCAPLLAIYGGSFDDLPCEIRYRLLGTPTEPLFE